MKGIKRPNMEIKRQKIERAWNGALYGVLAQINFI